MIRNFLTCLTGAVLLCAAPVPFEAAQPVPRIKATVLAFDGHVITVKPLSKSLPSMGDGPLHVSVLPTTRYVVTIPASLSDFKTGDYAGAAVTERRGSLVAREVFRYPPALAGTGEGRFTDDGRLMINGTVTQSRAGQFTLHYRGAVQNGAVCEGRAAPPALAGVLACSGTATISVPKAAAVTALEPGHAQMIVPGSVVTLSMAHDDSGGYVTPGVVIEGGSVVAKDPPSP